MIIRLTTRESDTEYLTKYLKREVVVNDDVIITLPSPETVSFDLSIHRKDIPFAFLNEEGLNVNSRKILSKHLRKYALAWINLANK